MMFSLIILMKNAFLINSDYKIQSACFFLPYYKIQTPPPDTPLLPKKKIIEKLVCVI